MAKAASNETLRAAFTAHLEETREQARRIERVAGMLGMNPGGKRCKGMAGLIEEGKEIMGEEGEDAVLDAALITAAQKVEHYEISAYGSARTLAERLGHGEASALSQTLNSKRLPAQRRDRAFLLHDFPDLSCTHRFRRTSGEMPFFRAIDRSSAERVASSG